MHNVLARWPTTQAHADYANRSNPVTGRPAPDRTWLSRKTGRRGALRTACDLATRSAELNMSEQCSCRALAKSGRWEIGSFPAAAVDVVDEGLSAQGELTQSQNPYEDGARAIDREWHQTLLLITRRFCLEVSCRPSVRGANEGGSCSGLSRDCTCAPSWDCPTILAAFQ